MMHRFLFGLFLFVSSVLSAQPLNVQVKSKSAILYNPANQTILFEKRAKEAHYPASIMKIATALYVLDQEGVDLKQRLRASKEALKVVNAEEKQADFLSFPPYVIEHDGVTIGIEEGKEYSVEALLHGALLASGNDASNVLAEGLGGTIEGFMEQMNRYVQSKGVTQTRFQNPHGLHHPAQMTTAYDMARIAGLAFDNPKFCEIILSPIYELEDGTNWENTNRFLKEGREKYPYFIGGKTGYVASAGYNLVVAMEKEGRRLIAVLLGGEKSADRFEDAIHLFEAAFREEEQKRYLFAKGQKGFVKDGVKKAKLKSDVQVSYFPSEETELSARLIWEEKGAEVGKLVVVNAAGVEIASSALIAEKSWKEGGGGKWVWWLLGFALLACSIKLCKVFKR
ncbi:MAG: D-alanyl-D-alanine carboxypeptidase [Simkaniaceae bacterium]|nr:D-alanyl-D-alanine carboxypeptidase [Candidatus Sacchlamyda saccharinae]